MPSQADTGIPVIHKPDGVNYKLFELPPELLELLESDQPPSLILQSSDTSAVLKAGSRSWNLRQKNTSNDLILLQATETSAASPAEMPEKGLRAVATVHDTIELVAESAPAAAPVARGKWHEKFARGR